MSQIPPVIPLDGTTISYSTECSPIEESSQILSILLPASAQQQQNNISSITSNTSSNLSGTIESFDGKTSNTQTAVGSVPSSDSSSMTMVMMKSPCYSADISPEQNTPCINESTDKVNFSSISFLQTKQRRIDHRRNKSEPVITASLEDLNSIPTTALESSSTSTTSNDSAMSSNASVENKRKSSTKTASPSIISKQSINGTSSLSSSTAKKKKAWYNPFQSSYRQRNEEFRKIFKDLPNEERLIVDYSCAWQKEILIQGRMFISQNYLCFHANFLKWETSLCLKFKDIVAITREKTAKVIPNAIEVKSNKNEKYFFASFATRDKTYAIIFRIWQTILIDQPLSSQQLWTMIHESYGHDLDMTTDEDDTYHKQSINSTPDKTSPKQQTKNKKNQKYHSETPNSIRSKSSEKEEIDDRSSISSRGDRQTDDDDDDVIPIGEEANTNTLIRQPQFNKDNKEDCLTPMAASSEITYLSRCPCQSHLATQLIDRTYPMPVERLFDCIFENNDFLVAYHASRRIKDYHATEWEVNEETGKRERLCTYKVTVTAVFGTTTICSSEKQIIDCDLSKSHYILDTEVRNEGIKYSDTFFIASRYCLVQIGPNKSNLKVTCEVRYIKSLMMIIKSFIEKNAMAALQDSYTDLNNRIDRSTSSVKHIDHESSNRQRSSIIILNNENQSIPTAKKKHSRKQQSNELHSSGNDMPTNRHRRQPTQDQIIHNTHSPNVVVSSSSNFLSSFRWLTNNMLIPFCLITMLILLSVNIFLCVKLNEIDRMTDRLVQNYPIWSNGYSYPKEESEWSLLLKRQEEYYQTKLTGLHSVLISTHNALKNVTDALNELSKVSSGTTPNAPMENIHSL